MASMELEWVVATAGSLRSEPIVAARLAFRATASAALLTPDSPEVKRAVAKGIKFLETSALNEGRPGALSLAAMSMLKNGGKPDHPRVVGAVDAIRKVVQGSGGDPTKINISIYDLGRFAEGRHLVGDHPYGALWE